MKMVKTILTALVVPLIFTSCQKDPEEFIENKPPKVFAGKDTTLQLTKSLNSIELTGSATDSDGVVVGYIWSQVSGPDGTVIISPGSATTFVKGLESGNYVFQLMAVDNKGATGLNSVSVNVLAPTVFTINLKPASNPNETVINSIELGNNNSLQELPPSFWTNSGSSVETRALLKFDLSNIPSGAVIVSAKLSLYAVPNPVNGDGVHAHSGSNNAVYIRRITTNWATSNLSWSNQPATSQLNQVELPATSNSSQDYTNLDVSNLIQDMVSNDNYGIMLQLKEPILYNIQNFASSKHADASKHPKLVVEYSN